MINNGSISIPAMVAQRESGIALTSITNELANAVNRIAFGSTGGAAGPRCPFHIKIVDSLSGYEKYKCEVYVATKDLLDPNNDLTSTNLEKMKVCDNAIFNNLQGVDQSTWSMTEADNDKQLYFPADFIGFHSDGRMVFQNAVIYTSDCSSTSSPDSESSSAGPGYGDGY